MQHVTALGAIPAGWPATAMPVGTGPGFQIPEAIAPDGFGGAIVAWQDWRNTGTAPDIFVQRINADGTLPPGWPANGTPAALLPVYYDDVPTVVPDGEGGAFIAWWAEGGGANRVYVQHLTGAGTVAPSWPALGLPLAASDRSQSWPSMIADGAGGVVIAWSDGRTSGPGVYAQRLTAAGEIAAGWSANGVLMVPTGGNQYLVSDGAGGAFIDCATGVQVYRGFDANYSVQRFRLDGTVVPGWPAGGVLVCTAPGPRAGMVASPDGVGGVLMTWYDYRDPYSSGDIYALRVRPDQSLAPGWTANGTLVSALPYFQSRPDIAPDGAGGAYLCWQIEFDFSRRAYVQHLTAQGLTAPGWLTGGVPVTSGAGPVDQFEPRIAADSLGGAIVVWGDGYGGVFAQRFVMDGPVAVAVSLVSAEASGDRVTLVWHEAGDRAPATLYRRAGSGEWAVIAHLDPDGEGLLRYEDRDVIPGTRYGYRLGIIEGGIEKLVGETSVEVPAAAELALKGVSPNPAVRDLNVAFSLAGSAPARLDLIDIAGRRVKSEEVGSLGAGSHVLNVNRDGLLAAGVYLVRLAQGMRTATARAIVVR